MSSLTDSDQKGSPRESQVHIASDSEVQNVIDFLSNSVYSPDPHTEGEPGERGERPDYPSTGYSKDGYPSSFGKGSHSGRGERVPTSDNSSSGSSGIGMEGPFRDGGRDPLRSRSTSLSPVGLDSERNPDNQQNGVGSVDSGINIQSQQQSRHRSHDRSYDLGRMSQDESELHMQERVKKRKSKEVLDFSQGFGPIINPGGSNDR